MSDNFNRELMPSESTGGVPSQALLPRRKLAVVIGIDDYPYLPKLRCAVSDAVGMQNLLVSHFGFEAPIPPLTNQAAHKRAIESVIEDQLRKLLRPDDALVLFFAGHGTTRLDRLDSMTVETGYLAPVEARGPDHFGDMLNMEELLRKIGVLPARHILVILDACHSGMALGSAMSQFRSMGSFANRLIQNRSRRVLTSARRDEPALDNGPIPGHSLFTGSLIQALTSGAADMDRNGIVTFSELALYLQQLVGQASGSRQTPDYGAFHLDDRGELVLAASSQALGQLRLQALPPPPRAGRRRRIVAVLVLMAGLVVLIILVAPMAASSSGSDTLICLTASGCRERADAYAVGNGVTQNEARAVQLYRKACDGGDARSCTKLGLNYTDSRGVPRDDARAVELFRKGCDGGDLDSCTNLGYHYMNGLGVPKDDARAAELARQSCDGGAADACTNLGILCMDGRGVPKDDVRAVELFRKGCDGGSAMGCANLAVHYMNGLGVPRDDTRAAELYRNGCDSGEMRGCSSLGFLHEQGRGVPRDEARAAELFRKTCDGGEPFGCSRLGRLYADGRGVPRDDTRAAELYSKACDGGEGVACSILAELYKNGKGVPKDEVRSAELSRKACDSGYAVGCTSLGIRYFDGRGFPAISPALPSFTAKPAMQGVLWAVPTSGACIIMAMVSPETLRARENSIAKLATRGMH